MLRESNMDAGVGLGIDAGMGAKRVCSEGPICPLGLPPKALVRLFAVKSQSNFRNVSSHRDHRPHLHYSYSLSSFVSRPIQLTHNTRSLVALPTLPSNQAVGRSNNHHPISEFVTILSQCGGLLSCDVSTASQNM